MLDAASLEKKGMHTVTVVWDNFEAAARGQAALQQVPDLEFLVVPRRQGADTASDQERKAEEAFPNLVSKLVESI